MSAGAVVLLSGGLDSSVLLHYVVNTLSHDPVHALSFNYGQRHSRELDCAAYQAGIAGVASHKCMDIGFLGAFLQAGSALIEGGDAVPDLEALDAAARTQPPTYVPNRNMMLLSMAAAYAETLGISHVYYGAQAQDEYGYWDCTAQFLERMNGVLALNRKDGVTVYAPFVARSKAETLRVWLELGVDFAHTWSCYRGLDVACGTCPTCIERLHAFRDCACTDPLPYA